VACSPPVPEAPEPPPPGSSTALLCSAVVRASASKGGAQDRDSQQNLVVPHGAAFRGVSSVLARRVCYRPKQVFVKLQVAPLSARTMDRCPRVSGSGSVSDQRLPRTAHEHAHALAHAIRGPTCAGPPFPEQS